MYQFGHVTSVFSITAQLPDRYPTCSLELGSVALVRLPQYVTPVGSHDMLPSFAWKKAPGASHHL